MAGSPLTIAFAIRDTAPLTSITLTYLGRGIRLPIASPDPSATQTTWNVPADLRAGRGRIRLTVHDAAGRGAVATSRTFRVQSPSSFAFVTSLDTMKESKDLATAGLTDAQISNDVNVAASLNTTHITVDTQMEYPSVMGQWVRAVRSTGRSVWFRLGSADCSQSRASYLQEMQSLIVSHPGFFRPGDIFDGDAEAENSCYWTEHCGANGAYGCPDQFNVFLQSLTTDADRAFAAIGLSGVTTWVHSTDPGTATSGLLNATTVRVDHGTVTVDLYPDGNTTDGATAAQAMLSALSEIHNRWANSDVVVGEAGFCLNIDVADGIQADVLTSEYTAVAQASYPWLRGWNYWVGAGGPGRGGYTNIFSGGTGNWTARPAAQALARFYQFELAK